jgi:ATPase family associated with various cellular activities (AAA)
MAKMQIKRDVLEKARQRAVLSEEEKQDLDEALGQGEGARESVATDLACLPQALLQALLDDPRLTPSQRAKVALQLYGMRDAPGADREEIYRISVASPTKFRAAFARLVGQAPNCELSFNGHWYPVTLLVASIRRLGESKSDVYVWATLSICNLKLQVAHIVPPELFRDDAGIRRPLAVLDVLLSFGFRALETTAGEFNLKLVRAERRAREQGRVVLINGPVLAAARGWPPWLAGGELRPSGTPESPSRAVVEPELELDERRGAYGRDHGLSPRYVTRLPYVRVFSLDTKDYVYADIDDVIPYESDDGALRRLHLPPEMLEILEQVFRTRPGALFGDLLGGKHGGAVILASGNPGVGKTLTAEVYSECTRRPLYVLEPGELGSAPAQVEENLRIIFARVSRWDAVLLFDECDIFLGRRGEDLGRSAIVGIFLRLLDYYRGFLFLTTNRPESLDYAVLSRVMLKIEYPDLDHAARAAVWRSMLGAAGLILAGGTPEELAEAELNGRQIRNLTRLAKILYPDGEVTLDQMRGILKYSSA